jgi:hypothetical protein
MQGIRRIKGVTVTTVLNGRGVDVVFKSPYRWRIYEGDREVTRDFGFIPGRALDHDDPRREAFHAAVEAGEINCRLHVAA